MKMNKKGFTLIEMLVVIAVISILVAIVIPTVTTATEKAKLATDAANIRAAIATVTTDALANDGTAEKEVVLTSKGDFSILGEDFTGISDFSVAQISGIAQAAVKVDKKLTITWGQDDCILINNISATGELPKVEEKPAQGEGGGE